MRIENWCCEPIGNQRLLQSMPPIVSSIVPNGGGGHEDCRHERAEELFAWSMPLP